MSSGTFGCSGPCRHGSGRFSSREGCGGEGWFGRGGLCTWVLGESSSPQGYLGRAGTCGEVSFGVVGESSRPHGNLGLAGICGEGLLTPFEGRRGVEGRDEEDEIGGEVSGWRSCREIVSALIPRSSPPFGTCDARSEENSDPKSLGVTSCISRKSLSLVCVRCRKSKGREILCRMGDSVASTGSC